MKRSTDRILTTHVGSLIRPPRSAGLPARQAGRQAATTRRPTTQCLTDTVAEVVRQQAEVGIDVVSDGEFGKSISWSQYVLERLSRLRAPAVQGRHGNPFTRGADRTRFAEFYAELDAKEGVATVDGRGLRSAPIKYTGQARAAARHRQFQSGAEEREGGRGLPAGGGAGQRHPRPQERILQERRGLAGRRSPRRCAPNTSRSSTTACWCSSTTRAPRSPTTAWCRRRASRTTASWLRAAGRDHQPRDRGPAGRPHPLSRLLGKLAGPAHHRRAAQGHRRPDPARCKVGAYVIEGANPRHEHEWKVWKDVKLPTGSGAHPRRHQPRHQRGRASGTGRRAHRAAREARRPRERHRRHRLRLRAGAVLSPRPSDHAVGEAGGAGRRRAAREQGTVGQRKEERAKKSAAKKSAPKKRRRRRPRARAA